MSSARTAQVVNLPCSKAARRERQLRALYAEHDALEQQLRQLRARIKPLEREVSRDRGFTFPQRREVLERPTRDPAPYPRD